MTVVDASVLVAVARPDERDHEVSLKWLRHRARARQPVAAPVLLLSEVGAAVRRTTGDARLAAEVVRRLRSSVLLRLVGVDAKLAELAADIAVNQAIRGCDAIYVALAALLDDDLVTLDGEQRERGARVVRTATAGDLAP